MYAHIYGFWPELRPDILPGAIPAKQELSQALGHHKYKHLWDRFVLQWWLVVRGCVLKP